MNEEKKDKLIHRFLEILPGVLLWFLLFLPLIGSISSIAEFIISLFIVLSIYWFYRAMLVAIGGAIGYIKYKKSMQTDWRKEIEKLDVNRLDNPSEIPNTKFPKQLIVIANYGENYDIIKRSINNLINQNYPKELIYLSFSIEERKAKVDKEYAQREKYLRRDFGDFFGDRLMFFVHPDNIPGEAIGAAANRAWGAKCAVEELEKRNEKIEDFLITAPDGDITFHKDYLAAMSYQWLVSENRNKKFYQTAIYTFNNNYWEVPLLIRLVSISLTIPVLASSIMEKHKRETFSCYSLNLKLMKDVDYWDTSLAIDDTTFYWRAYLYLNGDWKCEVFFAPLNADAIYNPKYLQNHAEQYKQYVRWGWGVISFPLGIKTLYSGANISLYEKITKTMHLLETFVLTKVIGYLIAFGLAILLFLNTSLDNYVISYTAPRTISTVLNITTIFLIPTAILKLLLIPPKPARMSKFKYILLMIIEIPLNIIILLTYSFLPFVEATTRMMLGQDHAKRIKWSEKQLSQN
jgi:hypothetical protein